MADLSIFTKIINGEIPCHKIYEDELTFAFLDIHPKAEGHVLVVPKREVENLWDLESTEYQAVMATVRLVASRLRTVLSNERVGLQVEGLDVPHAHVHVFPFATLQDFHVQPDLSAEPDHQVLAEIAKKLAF